MYYLKNPDSSGASAFLEKTLEKKTGVSKAYNVQNKQCTTLKIPIPAAPRRSWRKHSKKTGVSKAYNVQNKQNTDQIRIPAPNLKTSTGEKLRWLWIM